MHAGRIFFLDDEEEDYAYITNEVYILKEKMEPLQQTRGEVQEQGHEREQGRRKKDEAIMEGAERPRK